MRYELLLDWFTRYLRPEAEPTLAPVSEPAQRA
jgi:hypothetical protein